MYYNWVTDSYNLSHESELIGQELGHKEAKGTSSLEFGWLIKVNFTTLSTLGAIKADSTTNINILINFDSTFSV